MKWKILLGCLFAVALALAGALAWEVSSWRDAFVEQFVKLDRQQQTIEELTARTVRLEKQNRDLNNRTKELEMQVGTLERLEELGPVEEKKE